MRRLAQHYFGLLYTNAARAAIFVYLSPFVVAIGAHFFLKERLTSFRIAGLILAFFGIFLVFKGKPLNTTSLCLLAISMKP
jgi:drug/metabolite transporter (DMT)-like permease